MQACAQREVSNMLSRCLPAAGLMLFVQHLDWRLIWLWPGSSTAETRVAAMSRRNRNSRAWRYVWGGIRRDADARALVLASESEEWSYDRLEVSRQVLLDLKLALSWCVSFCWCHVMPLVYTPGRRKDVSPWEVSASNLPLAAVNSVGLFVLMSEARGWSFGLFARFVLELIMSPQERVEHNGSCYHILEMQTFSYPVPNFGFVAA